MKKHMKSINQGGFSILEVLIGIFIFAVGLLAISALQGALTRAMADSKVRTTAVNVAERLIESQRGFTQLLSDTANPRTFFAYNDIVSADTTETINGMTYTIDLDVRDYHYQLAGDTFTETAPTGASSSTYKQVEVTVSWDAVQNFRSIEGTDIDLGSGNIVLTASIPALVTSSSSRVALEDDDELVSPPVSYTPGLNPDIVSLSLGDTKFKESLLPEPDVHKTDELVDTRFDVITYSGAGSAAVFLRREEFATVSCECTLKAFDADNPGRRPAIWAGDEYVRGQEVVKTWGESANSRQSPLCDTCCRDHHDGGTSVDPLDHADTAVNTYVPFKPSTEYITSGTFDGDHKHYSRPRSGIPAEVTSAGSDYVEACRLVRRDGFFRVVQDFRREDLNMFPADFLVDSDQIDMYSSYLTGATTAYAGASFLDYEANPPCIGASPCAVPGPPKQGVYDAAIVMAGGKPTQLPSWTTLPLGVNTTQQLRSRGLYIDYLSYDIRQILLNCDPFTEDADDSDCKSGDVLLDKTGSVNLLELIPFFEVQMTKLNRWNEIPDPNIPIDTTNEPLADNNTHSRGVASKSVNGESTGVATGHRGNLGFTDTLPIDNMYDSEVTSTALFIYGGADTPPVTGTLISGTLTETVSGNPDIVVTGLHGAQCGQTSTTYSCLVPDGTSNPQLQITEYGKANTDRWACSTGLELIGDTGATVINGANAKATFNLAGKPEGTTYNFVIQAEACPITPPIVLIP